jgi:hypothetical protein
VSAVILASVSPNIHAAAVADLIDRLEDLAGFCAWLRPDVRTLEVEQALKLAQLRALEAACMIADLSETLSERERQAA